MAEKTQDKKSSAMAEARSDHQRTALKVGGTALLALAWQSLGIIYADIGTSPLYVLNGIWPSSGPAPSKEDVIGGISAIIWALTIFPLVKYVGVCLFFGTGEGEGGTFALFQGLYPRKHETELERSLTAVDNAPISSSRYQISALWKWPLLVWSLLGTSLTLADGVFTPAVSVTSAVGGIAVAKPSVSNNITAIAIAFLIVLFLAQPFGTAKLARVYSPITFLWFLLIGGCGVANITYAPEIFRAFDPSRAVMLFVRTGNYDFLSGIILAVTGCEALFANLGQFNASSIRLSFCTITYPALLLAYLGQGARLIHDGDSVINNVFYSTIPGPSNGPLFWIVYIFAIFATLIASQALITATFSLVQQLVNMKSLPPLSLVYTSEKIQGQVYIPMVNWLLGLACLIVVGVFKDLAAMTNAYGFAVATVMFTTTVLIAIQMRYVKGWPAVAGISFLIIFGFFDGIFWGACLRKVPHGAWVPLMIGLILLSIMTFWTWAKGLEDTFDGANRRNLRQFIMPRHDDTASSALDMAVASGRDDDSTSIASSVDYDYMAKQNMEEKEERKELVRIDTCAVFYKLSAGVGVPHSFVGFVRQWPALPRVVIFLSVRVLPIARVAVEDRYTVNKVGAVEGFYTCTYYLGFRDDFDVRVADVVERIVDLERRSSGDQASIQDTVDTIRRCAAHAPTHIVPHYYVSSLPVTAGPAFISAPINWVRRQLIENVYRHLAAMFPETKNWLSSADEIIHVGINATI